MLKQKAVAMSIIGRKKEIHILESFLSSKSPEFLAIYGRRRVGKTFLIKKFFEKKKIVFLNSTGEQDAPMGMQISHFTTQISNVFYGGIELKGGKNWDETFKLLTKAFDTIHKNKKIVLFFDEFPWMATKNSRLLQSLDYYWNQYWSNDNRIKLIICGSNASWIIDNIVNNKGGLHNRITKNIYLEPLNLAGTKDFLKSNGITLTPSQLVELYMCTGGIPYYLSKIEKGLSATQIIESLAFKKRGFLLQEFNNLFSSLFKESDIFIEIIETVASYRYGIGQLQLLKKMGKKLVGKGGLKKLNALKETGFIIDFKPLFHKEKGLYYKVIDFYCLFYFYWIAPVKDNLLQKTLTKGYWDKMKGTPSWSSWSGLAFEAICYEHLPQLSKALQLSPTAMPSVWRYVPRKDSNESGAQIDLLFDRDDDAITICEIKYSSEPFVLTKEYAEKLKQKCEVFKKVTRTKKQLFIVLITTHGIKQNKYSDELISNVVKLEDLFETAD